MGLRFFFLLAYFFSNLGKFINILAPGGGGGYFPHLPGDRKLVIWELLK